MTFFYQEILKMGTPFFFSILLAGIILFSSLRLSSYNPDTEKISAYEDARNIFDVRFYLVAIFFIIFDLEAVFFFPCVSISFLNLEFFMGLLDFLFEILVDFFYFWEVGALIVMESKNKNVKKYQEKYYLNSTNLSWSYFAHKSAKLDLALLDIILRKAFEKQVVLRSHFVHVSNFLRISVLLSKKRKVVTLKTFVELFKTEGLVLNEEPSVWKQMFGFEAQSAPQTVKEKFIVKIKKKKK